jgi:hypothetical protein
LLDGEALGDLIIAGEIEVDDIMCAGKIVEAAAIPRWRQLEQAGRDDARLREQEPADLCDVRARGDVDDVILAVGIKDIAAGKIAKLRINLGEIPRIAKIDDVPSNLLESDLKEVER